MEGDFRRIVWSETSNPRVHYPYWSFNIKNIADLSNFTEKEVLSKTVNFSKKAMFDLKVIMLKYGIEFKKEK